MTDTNTIDPKRLVLIAALVFVAFFGAYKFAQARTASSAGLDTGGVVAGAASVTGAAPTGSGLVDPNAAGSACGGGCCDTGQPTANGVTGAPVEGAAVVDGDVQRIKIDIPGIYDPNVIRLKAGVPAEITFAQSSGCTAQVMSQELGFFEDLTTGPKTVRLPALEPGEYGFSCGMQMVFGKIVVE